MNTILLIPTMRCSLQCDVCYFDMKENDIGYSFDGYGRSHHIENEISWQEWITGIDKYHPQHIEFTGGEATLYPGIVELIAHLPDYCEWAITSNTLSLKLAEINLKKCMHWTASYHSESNKTLFIENINYLKDNVPLRVSVVVEYNKFDKCIEDAEYFKNLGYKVNLLRELNPGVMWQYTNKWSALLSLRLKGYNVVEDDIPAEYKFEKGFYCLAGMNYFCAMPDGMVYKCYSSAMRGKPIGNIKDAVLNQSGHDCYDECLACAIDYKFRVRKLKEAVT